MIIEGKTTRVIDSDEYAAAGIETLDFPGGEPHVKIPKFEENLLLFLKLRSWKDLGYAVLLMDALDRQHAEFQAFVPYIPGARQDRSDGSAPLTLEVFGDLLDGGMGRAVHAFDPHSQICETYVCIDKVFMPADLRPSQRADVVGIMAPDAGAVDRAKHFRDAIYPGLPLIVADKKRDSASGRLSNYTLPPLEDEGHYIVVDDICDGGGTFNLLADAFLLDPAGRGSTLELLVSHGIFSKGLDAISPRYTHITTTDSWCQLPSSERLTVLPLAPLFPIIAGAQS